MNDAVYFSIFKVLLSCIVELSNNNAEDWKINEQNVRFIEINSSDCIPK